MSIQRTDLRFLLPRPARTVTLLGDLRADAASFELAGLEVVDGAADLAFAPAAGAREALARARLAAVVEGRADAAGRRFVALPDTARPAYVLPLDHPRVLRYGTRHFAGRGSRLSPVRNRVAPLALARGLVPAERALTVYALAPGPPFLVGAGRRAGIPVRGPAFWTTGSSDLLSRGGLFVAAPGAREPQWMIKFGRVPGARAAFDRDAAGLAVATRAGGAAAARAPRLLARLEVDGLPAAVETAAPGRSLQSLLESTAARRTKLAAIERIAAWLVVVAAQTAAAGGVRAELDRLRRDVLPAWEAGPALLDGLERLPAVLQHNDLGTWNLIVAGDRFTAVDWESARPAGLPLWDLVYFLSYAIVALDGVPAARHEDHLVEVYRGRTVSASLLSRWLGEATRTLGIDRAAIGPLVTTCWLHHGLSHRGRSDAVRAAGGEPAGAATALPRRLARRALDGELICAAP